MERINGVEVRVYNSDIVNAYSMFIPFLVKNFIIISTGVLNLSDCEKRAIIMHEYGHIKRGHTIYSFILIFLTVLTTFYLFTEGLVVGAFLITLAIIPFQRYLLRKMELDADKFATKYVGKDVLISLILKYGDEKASIFSTHPSASLRIKAITG
ncbi:MAG: M48 family metalloprotease [Sulfolobaceae archaeon]|nr:M48 family metalloprotease [Sulfolobaceae archaeon]